MRVLPAKVYDAIQLSALMYGGIGAGRWADGEVPVCYVGHLHATGNIKSLLALDPFGISELHNDEAVMGCRLTLPVTLDVGKRAGRISFEEWCKRLDVVRGEEPAVPSSEAQTAPALAGTST